MYSFESIWRSPNLSRYEQIPLSDILSFYYRKGSWPSYEQLVAVLGKSCVSKEKLKALFARGLIKGNGQSIVLVPLPSLAPEGIPGTYAAVSHVFKKSKNKVTDDPMGFAVIRGLRREKYSSIFLKDAAKKFTAHRIKAGQKLSYAEFRKYVHRLQKPTA